MSVIYVFKDRGFDDRCKIGKNDGVGRKAWPFRYEQARAHTPRGIDVVAAWNVGSRETARQLESKIKQRLGSQRSTETHGIEWFHISPTETVRMLQDAFALPSPFLLEANPHVPLYRGLPYDDWRERGDIAQGLCFKRLLWVHQEDGPEKRLKLIHSPLYDVAYKYVFTYNPRRVFLIAAYEHPFSEIGPSAQYLSGNRAVQAAWETIVKQYGGGLLTPEVGWLNTGTTMEQVDKVIRDLGLLPFDLRQPKPRYVRPRNGSAGGTPIPYLSVPPLARVRPYHS